MKMKAFARFVLPMELLAGMDLILGPPLMKCVIAGEMNFYMNIQSKRMKQKSFQKAAMGF